MAHILVVDDEDGIRKLLRYLLEKSGYRVSEAVNGKMAMISQHEDPADLVITDIFMPEQEGLETITKLKSEFPQVKILAISGGDRTGNVDSLKMAKMFGAHGTIKKPFKVQEIVQAVGELVG